MGLNSNVLKHATAGLLFLIYYQENFMFCLVKHENSFINIWAKYSTFFLVLAIHSEVYGSSDTKLACVRG